jgi:hypothetical protein
VKRRAEAENEREERSGRIRAEKHWRITIKG